MLKGFMRVKTNLIWSLGILATIGFFLIFLNENPINVFLIIWNSATASQFDLGMTFYYSTHFILSGLAVALCFQVGLFNVGVEGQLTMGALVGTVVTLLTQEWGLWFSGLLGLASAVVSAGIWAFIPVYLKVKRDSHEVISTIMMNFIAAGLSSYMIINHFPNPESQRPESAVLEATESIRSLDLTALFFEGSQVSAIFWLSIFLCLFFEVLIYRSMLGYKIRATGLNRISSNINQLKTSKILFCVFTLAGMIAGLSFLTEILFGFGQFRLGFSADYGFIGIAVALVARNRPIFIVPAGIFFAILHKGSSGLDFDSEVLTKDFSLIIQALLILTIVVNGKRGNHA